MTTKATDVDAVLAQRGKRYGKFVGHAAITQALKDIMRGSTDVETQWEELTDSQKECLDMVAHKIGRVLNPGADVSYSDNFVDISGYSKLVADELEGVSV